MTNFTGSNRFYASGIIVISGSSKVCCRCCANPMADFQIPARLLLQTDGERSLTNLLHLAEWLQRSATELDGENALIRHLGRAAASCQ